MLESHHRSCQCGAVYNRTESMAPGRQIASFECAVCGVTMESWNSTWVPTYRLIVGPVRHPGRDHDLRQMIQEDNKDQRAILQKLRNKMN